MTGAVAPESAAMKLMAAVGNLKDICSKTVSWLYSGAILSAMTSLIKSTGAFMHSFLIIYTHVFVRTGWSRPSNSGRAQKVPRPG